MGILTKSRPRTDKDFEKKKLLNCWSSSNKKKETAAVTCLKTRKADQLVSSVQYKRIFKPGQSCRWAASKFNYSVDNITISLVDAKSEYIQYIDWFWLSSGLSIRGNVLLLVTITRKDIQPMTYKVEVVDEPSFFVLLPFCVSLTANLQFQRLFIRQKQLYQLI